MLPVIWLNDSDSSPSWSWVVTWIRWLKSPLRTRSVPANSSCTDPVIDRASVRPIRRAAASMRRNSTARNSRTRSSSEPRL